MRRAARSIALVLAGIAIAFAAWGDSAELDLERAVNDAVNRHREEHGLAPLAWSEDAATLARGHSSDLAAGRSRFGHEGFEERRRILEAKLGSPVIAENVWQQSRASASVVDDAMARWLASPPHRRNIEGPYRLAGVGAARGVDGSLYLTQIFVGPATPAGAPGRGKPKR